MGGTFFLQDKNFFQGADQIQEFSVFLVTLITRLTMKKLLLIALLLLCKVGVMNAQCPPGESQVVVLIQPDAYPAETSWTLRDLYGNLIASGGSVGDTVCVTTGSCLIFRIQDTYGDGICCSFGNGFYAVYVNGAVQAAGGQFTYSETTYLNCPAGSHCGSA